MKKIVIVGGGASGIVAAVSAAKNADKNTIVQIIESNARLGKKLLTTGNGKCNITNLTTSKEVYNNTEFADAVLSQCNVSDVLSFFHEAGLLYYSDSEGRVYPYSNSSATVLNILLEQCKKYNIEITTDTTAKYFEKTSNGFNIVCEKCTIQCDILICSVGSLAGLAHPIDNKNLLKSFNIEAVKALPALAPIKTTKKDVEGLSGIRIKAKVKLFKDTDMIFEEKGEVLFKDDALSGIVIYNASLYLSRNHDANSRYFIHIDLMPDYKREELIKRYHNLNLSIRQYLDGIFNYKITNKIIKNCKACTIENIVDEIKDMKFIALQNHDFRESQICCGGIDTRFIDKNTMECLTTKGLFFTGEAVDIDAMSGGFNLQWAWSSGIVAGRNAAQAARDTNPKGISNAANK